MPSKSSLSANAAPAAFSYAGNKAVENRKVVNASILTCTTNWEALPAFQFTGLTPETLPFDIWTQLNEMDHVGQLDATFAIKRRLLQVELHFMARHLKSAFRQTLEITTDISELGEEGAMAYVNKSIIYHTNVGRCYRAVANSLGGVGALFFLHDDSLYDIESNFRAAGNMDRNTFLNKAKAEGLSGLVNSTHAKTGAIHNSLRSLSMAWLAGLQCLDASLDQTATAGPVQDTHGHA